MNVRAISASGHRMLGELARGISSRLDAEFVALPGINDGQVGIALRERDRRVVIELQVDTVIQATTDPIGRELLRTRIKARRDRMMFTVPPRALPKKIEPLFHPGPRQGGGYRGGRR